MTKAELSDRNRGPRASVCPLAEMMTSQTVMNPTTITSEPKRPLPLHWVEDGGFAVRPVIRPAPEPSRPVCPRPLVAEEAVLPPHFS